MSKKINTNFTPAIDVMIRELGAITALVYGRIWRYCQGEYSECFASQETIAKELGLSRVCINQQVGKLVKAGYLTETDKVGVTKTLRDTGKASIKLEITEETSKPPLQVTAQPINVVYNPKPEPVNVVDTTCKQDLHLPVNGVYTKIDIKKESKKVEYEDMGAPDEKFSEMQHLCERLLGRLFNPVDLETLDTFIREGVIEEDIKSALAWRKEQKLRPVSLLRQLEAGVLRNKAARIQAESAGAAPFSAGYIRPQTMSTLDKSLAAIARVMEKAKLEEVNGKPT